MTAPIRILGIDPGLRRTGWGVVDVAGSRLSFVGAGTLKPPEKEQLADRLAALFRMLSDVIAETNPDEVSIEETFVNKDARATLKLGQARGVALTVPALQGLAVSEYAANLIKKTVVGTGHAEKQQIRAMVGILLPRATLDSDDAADALAIAICHAHHRKAAHLVTL